MNDIRFHHGSSEWCFKGPDGKPYQYFNEVECHRLRQQYAADPSLFKSWPYIWHTTERGEFLAIKIGRKYGRIVTKCVRCTRCGGIGRAIEFELQSGFLSGTPGDWRKHNRVEKEVRAKVCTECWHKWITQRLMIIKEHPPFREDKILCNKMRTFLKLGDDENSTLPPHGWVRYPLWPDHVGNFVENLDIIQSLCGSSIYEWKKQGGRFYVRRAG